MGWGILSLMVFGAFVLLLASAGIEDVRKREIANWKNAAIALLAPLWWWSIGLPLWPDVAIQIALAAVVFAILSVDGVCPPSSALVKYRLMV